MYAIRSYYDADRYLAAYQQALVYLGRLSDPVGPPPASLSIKLSALHPRLEPSQQDRLQQELLPRLERLLAQARELDVPLTLDAEEQSRLAMTMNLFTALYRHPANRGWGNRITSYNVCYTKLLRGPFNLGIPVGAFHQSHR